MYIIGDNVTYHVLTVPFLRHVTTHNVHEIISKNTGRILIVTGVRNGSCDLAYLSRQFFI